MVYPPPCGNNGKVPKVLGTTPPIDRGGEGGSSQRAKEDMVPKAAETTPDVVLTRGCSHKAGGGGYVICPTAVWKRIFGTWESNSCPSASAPWGSSHSACFTRSVIPMAVNVTHRSCEAFQAICLLGGGGIRVAWHCRPWQGRPVSCVAVAVGGPPLVPGHYKHERGVAVLWCVCIDSMSITTFLTVEVGCPPLLALR